VKTGDTLERSWVGPLADHEVLLLCRDRLAPPPEGKMNYVTYLNADGEEVRESAPWRHFSQVNSFRTMDLATGRVKLEGAHYKGFEAKPQRTTFEKDGALRHAQDIMTRAADGGRDQGRNAPMHDGTDRTANNPQDASPRPLTHSHWCSLTFR
jgi:hypothetical protein